MSTTPESQPQRAMLSADAELGIPSQPLTATPPFFQSVFSLFSRKASLLVERFPPEDGHGCRAGSIQVLRWPVMRGIMASHLRRRGAPSHRVIHESEQEESDAAAYHGEGRMGRAYRPR